jgi:hypothetical protein
MKKLLALVTAVVALGAFAAPAPAEPPEAFVSVECDTTPGGGHITVNFFTRAGEAQRFAFTTLRENLRLNDLKCVPGTRQITVEPQ